MSESPTLILVPMSSPDSVGTLPGLAGSIQSNAEVVVIPYGVNVAEVRLALGPTPGSGPVVFTEVTVNALFWERAVNEAWAILHKRDHAGVVILREDARLAGGWLEELAACGRPTAVNGQGSGASDDAPIPGIDYGRVGLVGPVSDQTSNPAQHLALGEREVAMGLAAYATARSEQLAGQASSAEWLDLSWLWISSDCATAITEERDGHIRLLDAAAGPWAAHDLALRAESAGYLPVVAESVFATRTTPVPIGHQTPGDVLSRVHFYGKWASKNKRISACVRVALRSFHDLQMLKANLSRLNELVDSAALLFVTNPLEVQHDPEFQAMAQTGRVSMEDRTLLQACDGATPKQVKNAVAAWSARIFKRTLAVDVWQDPPGLGRERRSIYRQAEKQLAADWILSLEHDEIIEPRVSRQVIDRLVSHPNPMVRGYDLGFSHHWETAALVRDDLPWGDGGEYTGGPHGVRLWRTNPSGQPRRPSDSSRRHAPEIGPDGFRVANVRVRRFATMREADRRARFPAGVKTEGMRLSTFSRRDGIGMHMLVYERENVEDVARWLDDVHGLCDQVVLVWTGDELNPSVELTHIAALHGATFTHHPLADDLAAARNAGIDALARNDRLGWALFFDPDEWLTDRVAEGAVLRRMADSDRAGWLMQVANYRNDNSTPTISDSVRMSRLDDGSTMRMNGRVHEGFAKSIQAIQDAGGHPRLRYTPFVLQHRGMSFDETRMNQKLDHYEHLLRLDLADDSDNPGAWVSLGWHYANDGFPEMADECYARAIACAGTSYLPFKEMAYVHLRIAKDLVDKCHDRLTDAHQFYPVASKLKEFLTVYAPPHPVIPRTGDREPQPLPSFAPPEASG